MLKLTSAVVLAGALMLLQVGTLSAAGDSNTPPSFEDSRVAPYDHVIGTFRLDRTRSDDPSARPTWRCVDCRPASGTGCCD